MLGAKKNSVFKAYASSLFKSTDMVFENVSR
jgi:hypothetical protein